MRKFNLYSVFLTGFGIIVLFVIFWGIREILILEDISSLKTKSSVFSKKKSLLERNIALISSDKNILLSLSSINNKNKFNFLKSEHLNNKHKIINNFSQILSGSEEKTNNTPLKELREIKTLSNKANTLISIDYTNIADKIIKKKGNLLNFDVYYLEAYGTENLKPKSEIKNKLLSEINILQTELLQIFSEIEPKLTDAHLKCTTYVSGFESEILSEIKKSQNSTLFFFILIVILSVFIFQFFYGLINKPLNKIHERLEALTKGELPSDNTESGTRELNELTNTINTLVAGLRKSVNFSTEISKGNFDTEYNLLGEEDALGNSLLTLRDNLIIAQEEEEKRKKEDLQRNRTNEGLTLFNDIMRHQSGNINDLADEIISAMVKLIDANQGGLFFLNDEDKQNIQYDLLGAYAYNRKKHLFKSIIPGEGLIGAVVLEKHTVYMTDVPNEYIEIESGTGSANPKSILIVPLKIEDDVLGVIELASFNEIEQYEIEMVEKIAESIASSLANTAINLRLKTRLEKSQDYESQIEQQEGEIRKNIQELKKLTKKTGVIDTLKSENEMLKRKISELTKKP